MAEHPEFSLNPSTSDLSATITLDLAEALLGIDRVILIHLDGSRLRLTSPKPSESSHRVYSPGDKFKVAGKGFPKRKGVTFGDLYLTVKLVMPTSEELRYLSGTDVSVGVCIDNLVPQNASHLILPCFL